MSTQTVKFEVQTDYFHVEPSSEFYKILLKSVKETGSNLHVEFFNDDKTRPSEYTITKKSGGLIYMLESFANSKLGEKIAVSFEPPVSKNYLEEFKKRVEGSSLKYAD